MSSDDNPVLFRRAGNGFDRKAVSAFARRLRKEVAHDRPFSCLFTDDRELRRLNREFLDADYPTDVLSFPSGSEDSLGELAISTQRAAEQARDFGHSLEQELQILMLHGVLHLMGLDHEADRGSMARVEKQWRKKLGLAVGLIERSSR